MYDGRKERIIATVEARMTSSRLPGKVLLPLAGMPALELLVKRLHKAPSLDAVCIATTTNAADEPIVELAEKLGVAVFRGSESDVLGRVLGAAHSQHAETIVEVTGDCPFVDPMLVERGIKEFFTHGVEYASNMLEPSYPGGFDVQVFPTKILADAASRTNDIVDRTHVSYYIYKHPERYRVRSWTASADEFGPELRLTLDEQVDYSVLQTVARALLPKGIDFSAADVVSYLRAHPEIVALSANVRSKAPAEL